MNELFRKQLDENNILTKEIIDGLEIKHYHSGEPMREGQQALFAFLDKGRAKKGHAFDEYVYELIRVGSHELHKYESAENGREGGRIPYVKEKG